MLRHYMLRWFLRHNMPPPTMEQWVKIVVDVIREYINRRDWQAAFEKTGYSENQDNASTSVKQYVTTPALEYIPSIALTEEQLKCILPSNRRNSHFELFFPGLVPAPPPPAPLPLPAGPAPVVYPVLFESSATAARAVPAVPVLCEHSSATEPQGQSKGRGRSQPNPHPLSRLARGFARGRGRGRR